MLKESMWLTSHERVPLEATTAYRHGRMADKCALAQLYTIRGTLRKEILAAVARDSELMCQEVQQ